MTAHPALAQNAAVPSQVAAELVYDFDYDSDQAAADPFRAMAGLGDAPRVFYTSAGNPGWVVHRYEDARYVLQNPDIFSSKGIMTQLQEREGDAAALAEGFDLIPLEVDPPHHARYRALLNPIFSPKEIDRRDHYMREVAVELIESFLGKGECEFVDAFAKRFPPTVFLRMMGLPQSKLDDFLAWEDGLLHSNDRDLEAAAGMSIMAFLVEHINNKAEQPPQDDIISVLMQQEIDGQRLTQQDMMGFCMLFFVAGLDTVTNALGNIFAHLGRNPGERDRLIKAPELIPDAIEEMLRAFSVIVTQRFVKAETELHGARLKVGDLVTVFIPASNLDSTKYENPAKVNFARGAQDHLTFGAGPHRCMGSHLARREMKIAVEEFLQRIPNFTLKPGSSVPMNTGIIGPSKLELVW